MIDVDELNRRIATIEAFVKMLLESCEEKPTYNLRRPIAKSSAEGLSIELAAELSNGFVLTVVDPIP
jgi:hypothetical protein